MVWEVRGIKIVGVKLKDPRLFMIGVLCVYTTLGHTILAFDQEWIQIITSVLVACSLDVAYNFWKTRTIMLPASGLITGLGLGILIESIPFWPYIVAPFLAIASKAFLRVQDRQIFNPSNFGLATLLILTPGIVTTPTAQWSGSIIMVAVILVIGGFTSFRVARWDMVLAFVGGFCVMAFIEYLVKQSSFAFVYGPLVGAAFQLFILSMITDPKTTPETRRMRIVFGLALAVTDGVLRLMENQYSPFIALLIVAACVPICRAIESIVKQRLAAQSTDAEALQKAEA